MNAIRKAAVAGTFYPDDADVLRREVRKHMATAIGNDGKRIPKAIIAPHAGYRFSGDIAASAYTLLKPAADRISRVILMGPCHRVAVQGLALSGADYFETPLGRVEIDKSAEAEVADLPQVSVFAPTHEQEHSLEVHVPFLQEILGDFKLVPFVVGETSPAAVAEVLEKLWGGPETAIVISSDLSHFLDYEAAQQIDQRTCDAIEGLDPAKIERNGACGRFPMGGLLHYAKAHGMKVETLDVRNSGDTAGNKDRVVGYGSWAFYEGENKPRPRPLKITVRRPDTKQDTKGTSAKDFEAQTKQLLRDHGDRLIDIAIASIRRGYDKDAPKQVTLENIPPALRENGACFVTLKTAENQLRGCIGSPVAHQPLVVDVATNAQKAAFKDPRFKQVTAEEFETLRLSISVLSPQAPMTIADEADLLNQLRPGVDGLVIMDGNRRALFLPSVWEQLPDPKTFLGHLKRKAGMTEDHWSPDFKANRFIAEEVYAPYPLPAG